MITGCFKVYGFQTTKYYAAPEEETEGNLPMSSFITIV